MQLELFCFDRYTITNVVRLPHNQLPILYSLVLRIAKKSLPPSIFSASRVGRNAHDEGYTPILEREEHVSFGIKVFFSCWAIAAVSVHCDEHLDGFAYCEDAPPLSIFRLFCGRGS